MAAARRCQPRGAADRPWIGRRAVADIIQSECVL